MNWNRRFLLRGLKSRADEFRRDAATLLKAAELLDKACRSCYLREQPANFEDQRLAEMSDAELFEMLNGVGFWCPFCGTLLPTPDYENDQYCDTCHAVYGFDDTKKEYDFPRRAAKMLGVERNDLRIRFGAEVSFDRSGLFWFAKPEHQVRHILVFSRDDDNEPER